MDLNKKHVVIGIVLLIIAWIGNVFYYKKHVLKEPVFLKHYYDFTQNIRRFDLRYIQNINSKDKVATIVFPEIGKEYVDFEEYNNNSDRRYYQMKSICINIYEDDSGKILEEYKDKVITKAKVEFSSGKVMNVNIGKIYLCSSEEREDILKSCSASGGSDNSGARSFVVDNDIKIQAINSKFFNTANDALQIEINEKSLTDMSLPIDFKKGDTLDISHRFMFNKDDIRRNYVYDFPVYISIEDFKGNKGFASHYVNYWLQSPQDIDVNALINNKERE